MTIGKREQVYYTSMRDEPEERASLTLLERAAGTTADWRVMRRFSALIVERIFGTDSEAVQQQLSSDGEKLYAFDRVVRVIVITGTLMDTRNSPVYSEWRRFYEEARASAAAKKQRVVEVTTRGVTVRGVLVGSSASSLAAKPHQVDLSITVLCFSLTTTEAPPRIDGTDVIGMITEEGAARAGLTVTVAATDVSGIGFPLSETVTASPAGRPPMSVFEA